MTFEPILIMRIPEWIQGEALLIGVTKISKRLFFSHFIWALILAPAF